MTLSTPEGTVTLPNQFVFALTGYHPDFGFIERLGVKLDEATTAAPSAIPRRSRAMCPGSISRASSSPASAPTRYSSRTAASTAS